MPTSSKEYWGTQELQVLPSKCTNQQPNILAPNRTIRAELGVSRCWPKHGGLRITPQEVLCHRGGRWVMLCPQQSPMGSSTPGLGPAAAQEIPAVGGSARCWFPALLGTPILCAGAVGWAQLHQAELSDTSWGLCPCGSLRPS